MISDKCAADIARRLLLPFIELGMVPPEAFSNAVEMVKLRVEQDEHEKELERLGASIAVNTLLANAIKGLPGE